MNDAIWLLFIFSLNLNVSFSTKITECLCLNREQTREFQFGIKLFCGEIANEVDSTEYYSCHRDIFMDGKGRGLNNLTIGDGCRGSTLDPRISFAFKNLEFYNISHHGIERLSPDDLHFDDLKELLASRNNLTVIQTSLFIHAPKLAEIDLAFNNIATLETGAFSELNGLEYLSLIKNPIRRIDGKVFFPHNFHIDHYQNLEHFNASGSVLRASIVQMIELFGPRIKVLDLSSNFIGHLNGSIFERFKNLTLLDLSNTNLTHFDFNDFTNRAELLALDVSHNHLDRIHFTPYAGNFKSLKILNVIGNQLEEIDFVAQWNFPKLTLLGISENHFTCDYLRELQRRWPNLKWFNANSFWQTNVRGIECRPDKIGNLNEILKM